MFAVLPKIHPFSFGSEPASAGETISVQCTISIGDLPVVFSWMFREKPVVVEQGVSIVPIGKKVSVLNIDNASEEHAGNYTCIAANAAGLTSYSSELIVEGIKKF